MKLVRVENWWSDIQLRKITLIILYWLMVGLIAFLYETLVKAENGFLTDFKEDFWLLMAPPIIFGIPAIIIDQNWLRPFLKKISFYPSIALKVAFYTFAIILAYSSIIYWNFFLSETESVHHVAFLLKYILIWSAGTLIIFLFIGLAERLDPKTLVSWITGDYHLPKEEVRVFMFCDINDSTSIAEDLGSNQYFNFLRDFYEELTPAVRKFKGEIYQYIGDEIVISWKIDKAILNNNALNLFFHFEDQLRRKQSLFLKKYNLVPTIKASLHYGPITKGEIGITKKELIYTGDVLNTGARMHEMCKEKDAPLVISRRLLKLFDHSKQFQSNEIGTYTMRGKSESIFLYSLSKN
ncbi:MAG: adenylate/guanylate cyclase domain-containing protein [bacterium]|nr:adenylate/guanylate cyclase domain-containing protein [bacterium]